MTNSRESFDRNEPVYPGDPTVIPPDEPEEETVQDAPGEHTEKKGQRIHPPDLDNTAVFPNELTNR